MMGLIRCKNGHLFSEKRYGNICPYCSSAVSTEPEGDSSPGLEQEALYPVVGWLVCVEGAAKGKDFRIITEKNFIGRASDMEIRIVGDNHIAERNHAIIAYDPKNRKTFLLPGDSQGLVYLGGVSIFTPHELSPFDEIELGKSKFLFIPLCGENFEWQEEE